MSVLYLQPPWTDRYKQNWAEAYDRIMEWWNGGRLDRPVVVTPVLKNPADDVFSRFAASGCTASNDFDKQFQIDYATAINEGFSFPAESVPFAKTGYASSLGMLAAAAGAEIRYAPETGTAWAVEDPDLLERDLPAFNPECPPYAFTIEMIKVFHQTFGYDAVLGANPMVSPLTTLSMMIGQERFCLDIVDRPDDVKRWLDALGKIYMEIVSGWRSARAALGRREDYSWCGVWAPGDMDALECDFGALISNDMFQEFALPEAKREAEFFDYCFWHLDGSGQIKHLKDILSIEKVRAVQWSDDKKRSLLNMTDIWKMIREAGKGLLLGATVDEAAELTKRLGPDGLLFGLIDVKTEADMDAALLRLSHIR